jgi:2'-5' RNA ligase
MADVRTFVAVDLPPAVKTQIGQLTDGLRSLGSMVRWVRDTSLHLTLKFLGEIPEEQLPKIYGGVERAVSGVSPFSLVLAGLGGFPNLSKPRVIWLGILRGGESLEKLHEAVDAQLAPCGFPREKRKFSPHLTIGRVRSSHGIKTLLDRLPTIAFQSEEIPVAAVKIMRSQLKPTGAEYSALKVIGLG